MSYYIKANLPHFVLNSGTTTSFAWDERMCDSVEPTMERYNTEKRMQEVYKWKLIEEDDCIN